MRIVAFSDSHHNVSALKRICAVQQQADLFLHLGDAQGDIELLQRTLPGLPLSWVRGNCDLTASGPAELVLEVEGARILALHGHTLSVKHGLAMLSRRAAETGADVVLFGHTHVPFCEYREGRWFLNPGSVQSGGLLRFALVDIPETGPIACSLATIQR